MSLKTDVREFLENAQQLCAEAQDAKELEAILRDLSARLDQPLRVAIVGIIKAGKSTFLNALMGCDLVQTGTAETTYTVCWFRYAENPSITVCFRDGTQLQAPFEDLEKWSVRSSTENNPRIREVSELVVYYPSPVLKTIEFVDTPGLNSVYGTDAQNTLDFLSLQSSRDTLTAAGKADAVIFAFQQNMSDQDIGTLTKFHGTGQQCQSPINAIGIFTRVDEDWDPYEDQMSPLDKVAPVIRRYMKRQDISQLLYTILPVCAKPVEGIRNLDPEDWSLLQRCAALDPELLIDLAGDADYFSTSNDMDLEDLAPMAQRRHLIDRIASYGILTTAQLLRSGLTPEQIPEKLQDICGIRLVRQMVLNHFGNRVFLIKTQYIFSQLRSMIDQIRYAGSYSQATKTIAAHIKDQIERLSTSCQTLLELEVLQMFYNGQLRDMSEEENDDLLHITGEYGRLPAQRLGMDDGCSIQDLAICAEEKAEKWNFKAAMGFLYSAEYVKAAHIIARSYEVICHHLYALIEE